MLPNMMKKMLGILEEALENVEKLFQETKPDLIFGFVPVTLHEYLILKLAKIKNIPIRLLRSTKIENYISLNDSLFGLSSHIKASLEKPVKRESRLVVNNFIKKTRAKGSIYEGMHLHEYSQRKLFLISSIFKLFKSLFIEFKKMSDLDHYFDPHNPGYFIPTIIENFIQPINAYKLKRLIKSSNKRLFAISQRKFCLFPLHFEPEIALQIYARPLQNQIELARNIALSLPPGMLLMVKEHPRTIGVRSMGYYKKLLQIPNLALANVDSSSHELVKESTLVTVITGNIGLEVAVLKKPVVVFGETDYLELPNSMVKKCHNLYKLSEDINNLLLNYHFDEKN